MSIQLKITFLNQQEKIKILDKNDNSYNFTQIYIDEKKREILGTDIKAYLNQESFKIREKINQEYLQIL